MRDISQGSTVKMRHIDFWCDTCALAAALIKQEWKLVMDGTVMCCVWSSSLENTDLGYDNILPRDGQKSCPKVA